MHEQVFVHEDDIYFEGFLLKRSAFFRKWRKRWCVLTSQSLCAFRVKGDYRKPTEVIRLRDCSSVMLADADTGKENSFSVETEDRTFCLVAGSAIEKGMWMDAIISSCFLQFIVFGTEHPLSAFAIAEDTADDVTVCTVDTTIPVSMGDFTQNIIGGYSRLSHVSSDLSIASDMMEASSRLSHVPSELSIASDVMETPSVSNDGHTVQESNDDCIWSNTDGESGEPLSPYGWSRSSRKRCHLAPISAIVDDVTEGDMTPTCRVQLQGIATATRLNCGNLATWPRIVGKAPATEKVCDVADTIQVSKDDCTWNSARGKPLCPVSPMSQINYDWVNNRCRPSPITVIHANAAEAGEVHNVVDSSDMSNDENIWSSMPLSPQSPMTQLACAWGRSRRKRLPQAISVIQLGTEVTEVCKSVEKVCVGDEDCLGSFTDEFPLSPLSTLCRRKRR